MAVADTADILLLAASSEDMRTRAGATKIACCGYGWGSSCVLPLAQVRCHPALAHAHIYLYVG